MSNHRAIKTYTITFDSQLPTLKQIKAKRIALTFRATHSIFRIVILRMCPANFNANSYFCRKATEEMLRRAREDQVKNKEHFLAVQAGRDRAEFERVLR